MSFDEVLDVYVGMGRSQFTITCITFLIVTYGGWHQLMTIFAAQDVDFYCSDKVLPGATQNISQIQPSVYDNKCVANCSHYKYRPGISSLKIDFNLYCGDKSNMKNWIHAPYWVGYIISNIFGGYLGDKTGRKPFCVLSLAVYTLASAATTLSPKTEVFLALRGITGMANGGCYTLGYLILVECVSKKHVSKIALTAAIMYGVGGITAAVSAYCFIFSWKLQFLAFSIAVGVCFVLAVLILTESPRWLYAKGKLDRAESVLKWMARMNGKDETLISLKDMSLDKDLARENSDFEQSKPSENESFLTSDLTLTKVETKRPQSFWLFGLCLTFRGTMVALSQLLIWGSCSVIYMALCFDAQEIGYDFYLSSIFLSLCELPTVTIYKIADKFGRKPTVLIGTLIGALACFILPFTKGLLKGHVQISLAIFAKILVTGSYNCLYIYTPESFPTVLRSTAVNLCFIAQNIAATIASVMIETNFGPSNSGPYLVYGIIGIIAVLIATVFGKETKNTQLFNTVEEYQIFAEL